MDLRLERLTAENFKGLEHVSIAFGGKSCTVYGDNAAGKTSLYDALLWLLFDKDSRGRKDFEVKPLGLDGKVKDHGAVTSVEAALSLDGQPVTLRRSFREVWAAKRGGGREEFSGHTNEYSVDGVPCKKYEFERRLSEIVREDTFRLLTSTSYFSADMAWRERRRVLFDICGAVSEGELLANSPEFARLAAAVGGLPVEDYKKKILAERKALSGARDSIPARLDECRKTADGLRGMDFVALRARLEEQAARREQLLAELVRLENNSLLDDRRHERDALRNRLEALEAKNREHCAERRAAMAALESERRELSDLRGQIGEWKAEARRLDRGAEYEAELEDCRAKWRAENGRAYHHDSEIESAARRKRISFCVNPAEKSPHNTEIFVPAVDKSGRMSEQAFQDHGKQSGQEKPEEFSQPCPKPHGI